MPDCTSERILIFEYVNHGANMNNFDMAGEYSRHVAFSNLIGIKPMSYAQWVRANTPA